ncbi:hypothetical protein [Paraherbaspirillum soli]
MHTILGLLGVAVLTVAESAIAASEQIPQHANVMEQKKNALLRIEQGAIATIGAGRNLNGIAGTTNDFRGQPLPAFIIFDTSVPESRLTALTNFQGRLAGTMDCKLIQLGNSPDVPSVKLAVLAQNCTIKQLNH